LVIYISEHESNLKTPSSHRLLLLLGVLAALSGLAWIVAHFQSQRSGGHSAAEWSIMMAYGTPAERQAAEAALRQLGERAVPSLRRALHAGDPPFKSFLFRVANHSPTAVQRWIIREYLFADAATRHALAAQAMGFIGPPAAAAAPDLEAALRQGDQRLASAAAAALGNLGPTALPALIRSLAHPNPVIRQAASYGLSFPRTNATPAIPALCRALADTNEAVRASAAYALTRIWTVPATGFVALVEQETGQAREAAAQALQNFRTPTRLAQPALRRMLESTSPTERRQATASLAYLQPWSPEVFAALVAALSDPSAPVRLTATNALSPVNLRARASLVMLTQNLSNSRPEMRASSAWVLGNFGTNAAPALPALAALAADTNAAVRAAATEARDLIQPPPIPPP
jgi:HEAT repeat protein